MLPALKHLFLACNKLTEMPPVHTALPLLETLDLGNNCLVSVPDGLRFLSHLSFISLENNELQRLPLELAVCMGLRSLLVGGNPQRAIKQEVIAKGLMHVLAALRRQIPDGDPLLECSVKKLATPVGDAEGASGARQLKARVAELAAAVEDLSLSQATLITIITLITLKPNNPHNPRRRSSQ